MISPNAMQTPNVKVLILGQTQEEFDDYEGYRTEIFKLKAYDFDGLRINGWYLSPWLGRLRSSMKQAAVHAIIPVDAERLGDTQYRRDLRTSLDVVGELPVTFAATGRKDDYVELVNELMDVTSRDSIDLIEGENQNSSIYNAVLGLYEVLSS